MANRSTTAALTTISLGLLQGTHRQLNGPSQTDKSLRPILIVSSHRYHQSHHCRHLIQERNGPEGDALNPVDFAHPTVMRGSQSIAMNKRQRYFGVDTSGSTCFICNMGDGSVRTEQAITLEFRLKLDGKRDEYLDDLARVVSRNNKESTMPHRVVWE